jgi:hypothetical protein
MPQVPVDEPVHTGVGIIGGAGVPRRSSFDGAGSAPEAASAGENDGRPRMRLLAGACAWALVLALGGLLSGILALITIIGGSGPGWYEPAIVIVGIIGMGLTVAAFPLLEKRIVPWALLGAATVTLIVSFAL